MSGLCWKSWGSAEAFRHITGANSPKVDALKRVSERVTIYLHHLFPKVWLSRPRREHRNLIFPTRVSVDVWVPCFSSYAGCCLRDPQPLFRITNGVTGCGVGVGGAWVGEEQPGLRLEPVKRSESDHHILVSNRKPAPGLLSTLWLWSTSLVHRPPRHHPLCGGPW